MADEILEVSEICPDTNHTMRVLLLRHGDNFEILVEVKELTNAGYEFIQVSAQEISGSEASARTEFNFVVMQIASLDSLD